VLLKLKCRNPRRVSGDVIGGLKPHRKGHSGAVQHSASCYGGLMAAGRALDAFVLFEPVGIFGRTTLRTDEALRPAGLIEVVYSGFGIGKPTSKLKYGFWEGDSVFPHAPSFLMA
jgi:hypothetical protein